MAKQKINEILRGIWATTRKHSPEILTGIGIAGMITTTVLAVKATPKAMQLMSDAENKKQAPLSAKEKVEAAWTCYIPAAIVGGLSIGCIIGASSTNFKRNAALATAYTLSETTLKEYQDKVVEVIGEKKEEEIREAVVKDKLADNPIKEVVLIDAGGNTICYDALSGRYICRSRRAIFPRRKPFRA